MTYKRSGDWSFHPIKEVKGKVIEHKGSFVFGVGEKSSYNHVITAVAEAMAWKSSSDEYPLDPAVWLASVPLIDEA